jgi:hypothetical protein
MVIYRNTKLLQILCTYQLDKMVNGDCRNDEGTLNRSINDDQQHNNMESNTDTNKANDDENLKTNYQQQVSQTNQQARRQSDSIPSSKNNLCIISLNPGFVPHTGLVRRFDIGKRFLMKYVLPFMPFAKTLDQVFFLKSHLDFMHIPDSHLFLKAGNVLVYAATSPNLDNCSGIYLNENCKIVASSDESYDREKQKLWWNISCQLTGLSQT